MYLNIESERRLRIFHGIHATVLIDGAKSKDIVAVDDDDGWAMTLIRDNDGRAEATVTDGLMRQCIDGDVRIIFHVASHQRRRCNACDYVEPLNPREHSRMLYSIVNTDFEATSDLECGECRLRRRAHNNERVYAVPETAEEAEEITAAVEAHAYRPQNPGQGAIYHGTRGRISTYFMPWARDHS